MHAKLLDMSELLMVDRGDGVRLAARHTPGRGPTWLFLPGYMSDMAGTKAEALFDHAVATGRACLLLDYSGCGRSEGEFDAGTVRRWAMDALAVADALAPGPLIPIGSSMGGAVMLHLALAVPDRARALVGIAPAPDFTRWGVQLEAREIDRLRHLGFVTRPSAYAESPYRYSRALLEDGEEAPLLEGEIPLFCPVRLLHGTLDDAVPVEISHRLMAALGSADVQLTLVKNGDHRLSSPAQIDLLIRTLEALDAALPGG